MSEPKFLKAKPIVNFPEAEAAIQEFWDNNCIFEKSLRLRQGGPRFTFYEGPPTANGLPHNGHVLTRVFKDIFLRYRTMQGFDVPRKAGWDTHGLPVEVEVEKELGIHGKQAIEEYGVKGFILHCMRSVFRYTAEWERMTKRAGFWVDLSDAYVTYHKSYVESVWWALSELFRQGLLYQGHKIVWWWPQGGTALSAGEVGLGYKSVDDPSVYVALELVDEPGTYLLIWTTTPWTLPSNQYTAVRPDYDYVLVRDGEQLGQLFVALDPPEAFLRQPQTGPHPALALIASPPAPHPATDATHHRERRLDRIRRRQRRAQQIVKLESVHRQRFLPPFFEGTRRRGMQLPQIAVQLLQSFLGVSVVRHRISVGHLAVHRCAVFLRQVSGHIAALVHWAALDQRHLARVFADRLG